MNTPDRFWSKVAAPVEPGGCWAWMGGVTGGRNAGYGEFWSDGRHVKAHRLAYEKLRGPILPEMTLDHLCRNRTCVNPMHLEMASQRTNLLRGTGQPARNAAKTECVRGHPFDERNTGYRRNDGGRYCRECLRLASQVRRDVLRAALEEKP